MRRLLAALMVAVFLLAACGQAPSSASSEPLATGGSTTRAGVASDEIQFRPAAEGATIAVMETSEGTIRFVLYPQYAPLAVENFCTLAQAGYYDGTVFHRIVEDFIIQGGDATGTGTSGHSIWGSALLTERSDFLHHYSGALCLAAADGRADTHYSQFYVVTTPQTGLDETALARLTAAGYRADVVDAYRQAGGAPYLDNTDTVFGQVIDGMDVADKIARTPLTEEGSPRRTVTVERVTILNYPPTEVERPDSVSTPPPADGGEDLVDMDGGDLSDVSEG